MDVDEGSDKDLDLCTYKDNHGRYEPRHVISNSDFQQCSILTSLNSDEPVQPPFKLRNSKIIDVESVAEHS